MPNSIFQDNARRPKSKLRSSVRHAAAPRHRHFAANPKGRDFVVGDLHGCLDLLSSLMREVQFDPSTDRLFSVGDLIDRGPDNLGSLRLLNEPWFHTVLGNHERMMLDFVGSGGTAIDWLANGGDWFLSEWRSQRREELAELIDEVSRMPLMVTVMLPDATRFHVIHAEFPRGAVRSEADIDDRSTMEKLFAARNAWGAQSVLWGRDVFEIASFQPLNPATLADLRAFNESVIRETGGPRIYSGHTVVRAPLQIANLVDLDTGAFLTVDDEEPWAGLTMTEPSTGLYWTAKSDGVRDATVVAV